MPRIIPPMPQITQPGDLIVGDLAEGFPVILPSGPPDHYLVVNPGGDLEWRPFTHTVGSTASIILSIVAGQITAAVVDSYFESRYLQHTTDETKTGALTITKQDVALTLNTPVAGTDVELWFNDAGVGKWLIYKNSTNELRFYNADLGRIEMQLYKTGGMYLANLAGGGSRMMFADNSGNVTVDTLPVLVQKDGVSEIGPRQRVNFTDTGWAVITAADDSGNDRFNIDVNVPAKALDDLTDVAISGPADGDQMWHDGTGWQNGAARYSVASALTITASTASAFPLISNTDAPNGTLTLPQGMYYFSTNWVIATGGTVSSTLSIIFAGTFVGAIRGVTFCGFATTAAGPTTGTINVHYISAINGTVNELVGAIASARTYYCKVDGNINVSTAGTVIPQLKFSAAPGADINKTFAMMLVWEGNDPTGANIETTGPWS